jgi:hypothetical protein
MPRATARTRPAGPVFVHVCVCVCVFVCVLVCLYTFVCLLSCVYIYINYVETASTTHAGPVSVREYVRVHRYDCKYT